MKFIPILFSTPMVQAIDADRKTQTRRTSIGLKEINQSPDDWTFSHVNPSGTFFVFKNKNVKDMTFVESKYGQPGDVLWVRESFNLIHDAETDEFIRYGYKAYWSEGITSHTKNKGIWKPSIHMPKKACRLFLRIKDIRVERLRNIPREDCKKEGIAYNQTYYEKIKGLQGRYYDYIGKTFSPRNPITPSMSFFSLWESINGKESLELNPWVWVIEFEKIEKPENFI